MNNSTEEYLDVTHSANRRHLAALYRAFFKSPEYLAVPIIWKAWSPCLLLLGGFGNVATIFVMRRIRDHNSSYHVFLIALAVADLSYMCVGVLRLFMHYYFKVRLENLHTVACKLHMWLFDASYQLSAWFVTAVTVQRTLAIKWPHKIRMMCTERRTWIIVAALVFASCALNSDILITHGVLRRKCTFRRESASYMFFIQYIRTWLGFSVGSFLPFVCLLLCNVILSLSLFQATSAISVANQATSNVPSAQSNNSRRKTAKRTTIMILTLSISFLILTMPAPVVLLWGNLSLTQRYRNPEMFVMHYLTYNVAQVLVSTNSAVNFFLYCVTGTKFRREFLSWICCSVPDHSSRSVGKTASVSRERNNITAHESPASL